MGEPQKKKKKHDTFIFGCLTNNCSAFKANKDEKKERDRKGQDKKKNKQVHLKLLIIPVQRIARQCVQSRLPYRPLLLAFLLTVNDNSFVAC